MQVLNRPNQGTNGKNKSSNGKSITYTLFTGASPEKKKNPTPGKSVIKDAELAQVKAHWNVSSCVQCCEV